MKRYEFIFVDGSQATITVELNKNRHMNMKEEIEGIKAAITSIVRNRPIKSYSVIQV